MNPTPRPGAIRWTLLSILTAATLAGCSGTAAPISGAATAPAAQPAEDLRVHAMPDNLHWMRNATEYRAAVIQVFRAAGQRLEEVAVVREPGSWAVALDADETLINNMQYQKERAEIGLGFSAESWAAWVRRREATLLPGALTFLNRVRELGGRIAIVTNRADTQCPATEENMAALGIPFDVALCRPPDEREKEPRWHRVEEGTAKPGLGPLEIVMWIGDNIGDFPDLDQELRHQDESAFGPFGSRYFVIPNAAYGSWEQNPRQ